MTWALHIARALEYMHENERIIHLDVKPQNMALNSALQIKLCNFESSSRMEEIIFTQEVGTPVYMAPEVFIDQKEYSEKCDTYSWALSFWRCFMEERPFNDCPDRATLNVEKRKSERSLAIIPESSEFPSEMNAIIQECYSHDSASRPSMTNVVKRLEKILNINQP